MERRFVDGAVRGLNDLPFECLWHSCHTSQQFTFPWLENEGVVSVPQGSVPDDPTATSLSYEIDARQLDMSTSTTGARYTDDLMVLTENRSVINPAFVPIGARETIVSTTTGYDIVSGTNAVLRRMTLPYEPQGIEILGRSAGYIYYLATDGHNDIDGNLVFNRYVFKFSLANNAPVATYTLRSTLTRPNRDIVLAADEVYQMTISNTSASVVKLNPDLAGTPVGSVYAGAGDGSSTNSVPLGELLQCHGWLDRNVAIQLDLY